MERQQADPETLRLMIALEEALNSGMTAMAEQIAEIIARRADKDTSAALAEAFAIITAFFVYMATTTRETQRNIAQAQVNRFLGQYDDLLRRAGATAVERNAFTQKLQEYPNRVNRAFFKKPFPVDNVAFDVRIKTIRDGTQRTVRNIVRNGTARGESARVMARKVESYLKPGFVGAKVEPLKEARIANSLDKRAKPLGVRKGSIPYNAIRIARTESAETYRASHVQMYEGTRVEGGKYDWVLSNSHAGPDRCDDLAKRSPYDGTKRPHSHPNCLCDFRKRPPTLAEVRKLLQEQRNR